MTPDAPMPSGRRPRGSWLPPAVVAALMLAYVAPFAWVNLIPDGIRDLQASLVIARGGGFQRFGPLINFTFYLGPLSLYLQALPLVLASSFTAVGLWIGLVGSLKFPFAYLAGRALHSRQLGLLVALAVALPSVAGYQWMFLFHPTLVEPFVWAALMLAARCALRPSATQLYGIALAVGIAIQFHPTAAFYAPLPWVLLLAQRRAFPRWPLHALLLLLPLAAPFLPLLAGGLDADTFRPAALAAARAGAMPGPPVPVLRALSDVPMLFGAMFWDIPAFMVGDALVPRVGAATGLAIGRVLQGGVLAVALWGAFRLGRSPRRVRVAGVLAALALVAGVTIASLMRESVGFYTLYFLLPLSASVLGICLFAATMPARGDDAAPAPARAVAVAVLLALAAGLCVETIRQARAGVLDIYVSGLGDLRALSEMRARAGRYAMTSRDRVGPWLCRELATADGVVLHGDLAFDEAASFGVDLRMHCPARIDAGPLPRLLGRADAGAHWLALPAASWQAIGREPALWLGELGVRQPVAVLHPASARGLDVKWHYYEVVHDRQPVTTLRYDVPAGAPHLLVSRLKPWTTKHDVAVTCGGAVVPAAVDTLATQVYALTNAPCAIAVTTDVPEWVGIAQF